MNTRTLFIIPDAVARDSFGEACLLTECKR
jgi:hypothetical protein